MLFSIVAVLFFSCGIIKQIDFAIKGVRMIKKSEETYYYGKKISFVLYKDAIFIPCKINDTMSLVYYDSEMSGMNVRHGLLREEISGNAKLPKCNKTIKLRAKNDSNQRVVIKSGLKYYNLESDFFYFKNLVGVITSVSNDTITSECIFEKKQNRFTIGKDVFPNRKGSMLLNFSDTTITLLDSISTYDTTGFTFVKSLNSCEGLTICLTIDSIEYAFVFNTGFSGFLSLPQYAKHRKCLIVDGNFKCDHFYVQYEKHKKENDMLIVSYREQNIIDTLITQQTNTITMGDWDSISGEIHYVKKLTRPVMGMEFISHFDWIIDIYKQKIYVKKIKESDKKENE